MSLCNEKLVLGTVQFGLDYGVNNTGGKPSYGQCKEILSRAYERGVRILDTADVYGDSYAIIGRYHQETGNIFRIHTKFKKFPNCIETYFSELKRTLYVEEIDYVYFHNFKNYLLEKDRLKQSGLLLNAGVGVSIYTEDELEIAVMDDLLKIIQLPLNLLDHRGEKVELLKRAKEGGKTIASRSSFLQGLFFMQKIEFPEKLRALYPKIQNLRSIAQEYDLSLEEMAVKYPMSLPEVDLVLMGVETSSQLDENLNLLNSFLNDEVISAIEGIKVSDKGLLNPANW